MSRALALGAVLVAAAALAGAAVFTGESAAKGPFYVVPGPRQTTECDNLQFCRAIPGPWVVVPAQGEATYLLSCPARALELGHFLLGGSDARVSSSQIRVWYDGKLGQLGLPSGTSTQSPGLLFHAESENGKLGSFQPVVGCISLREATKRSTVSARETPLPPSVVPRAQTVELEPGQGRTTTQACLHSETAVGSWSSIGYEIDSPPRLPLAAAVTAPTHLVRGAVHATIRTRANIPYLIYVQIGALCQHS